MNKTPVYAVIMAGGKGKRINARDIPKVLYPVAGRPMLKYVYEAIKPVADEVVIITGFQDEKVRAAMGNGGVKYAHQAEQLGTAHAVAQAESLLKGKEGIAIIVNGDHPLVSTETFRRLVEKMQRDDDTLLITSVSDDKHTGYGRVLRDKDKKVIGVIEAKDASPEELKIHEKNVGLYAVKNSWLWPALKRVNRSSVTGEYYITDLVGLAIADGEKVETVSVVHPYEVEGINTIEELKNVEAIIACKKK